MNTSTLRPYLNRLVIVLIISLIFAVGFNEISFLLQKDKYDRAPETVTLVIPQGTAAQVQAGEDVPSIPSEMVFVLGDVLSVRNEDDVSHQLGPIWVPPGTTGSLVMEQAQNIVLSCSFATSRYLGLDVRQPTTMGIRLIGLGISVPTMAALIFIYSLLVYPIKTKTSASQELTRDKKQDEYLHENV
jgi:hypothetical protein